MRFSGNSSWNRNNVVGRAFLRLYSSLRDIPNGARVMKSELTVVLFAVGAEEPGLAHADTIVAAGAVEPTTAAAVTYTHTSTLATPRHKSNATAQTHKCQIMQKYSQSVSQEPQAAPYECARRPLSTTLGPSRRHPS
jgi:hypothetical protein